MAGESVHLSICAIYRDEARYLREWIEFHRLVGVERFFLYDNRSGDDHEAVLEPYVSAGIAEVLDWPQFPGQCAAYENCLERQRANSRWIVFIDVDEFLFSPTLLPLAEVLKGYERFPGIGVHSVVFGSSGHRTPPAGLVIESYLLRAERRGDAPGGIKSIVDPVRAVRCSGGGSNPHAFIYRDGFAVNERMQPIERRPFHLSEPVSLSRLRINHYWIKSEQQWRRKVRLPQAHSGELSPIREEAFAARDARACRVRDETILAYVPALRRALARPAGPLAPVRLSQAGAAAREPGRHQAQRR